MVGLKKRIAILYLSLILTPVLSFMFIFGDAAGISVKIEGGSRQKGEVPVSGSQDIMVIPGGNSIGVNIDIDGVLVMGTSDMLAQDDKKYSPAKDAGIKNGDIIRRINDKEIEGLNELTDIINQDAPKNPVLAVELERGKRLIKTKVVTRVSKEDKEYKIAAWVKDNTSGIGTLTYYNPENNTFGALGHGITDTETGQLLKITKGNILSSSIISVKKGEKGQPGELKGIFLEEGEKMGSIFKNTEFGLFGEINSEMMDKKQNLMKIGGKNEIKEGKANILSNIDGEKVESFEIEIQKIMKSNSDKSKCMVVKVTDSNLLEKTGGIVQGMSGSPIIQNDRLIGAITHVFVNDPTKGYAIFIESMLENSQNNL